MMGGGMNLILKIAAGVLFFALVLGLAGWFTYATW